MWTCIDTKGPQIRNNSRCKQIIKAAHVSARHCHSCTAVFLPHSAPVQNSTVLNQKQDVCKKQKKQWWRGGRARKCKAITAEIGVKIIEKRWQTSFVLMSRSTSVTILKTKHKTIKREIFNALQYIFVPNIYDSLCHTNKPNLRMFSQNKTCKSDLLYS